MSIRKGKTNYLHIPTNLTTKQQQMTTTSKTQMDFGYDTFGYFPFSTYNVCSADPIIETLNCGDFTIFIKYHKIQVHNIDYSYYYLTFNHGNYTWASHIEWDYGLCHHGYGERLTINDEDNIALLKRCIHKEEFPNPRTYIRTYPPNYTPNKPRSPLSLKPASIAINAPTVFVSPDQEMKLRFKYSNCFYEDEKIYHTYTLTPIHSI